MSEGDTTPSADRKLKEELPLSFVTPLDLLPLGEVRESEFGGVFNLRDNMGEESHEEDFCLSTDEWEKVLLAEGD